MKRFAAATLFVFPLLFTIKSLAGYDPTIQRWIQRDPMDVPQHMERDPLPKMDFNLYSFVGNNPVNRVDPFGLDYYTVYVTAFSGFPHQVVVGDDGSGGSYVIDYGPANGGLNRISGPGQYNYSSYSYPPNQSAYDLSKAKCTKTSPRTDKALSELAAGLSASPDQPHYACFGNNCWTTGPIFDAAANNYQNFGTLYAPINTLVNLPPKITIHN